jgi:hypothetical protein
MSQKIEVILPAKLLSQFVFLTFTGPNSAWVFSKHMFLSESCHPCDSVVATMAKEGDGVPQVSKEFWEGKRMFLKNFFSNKY